MSRSNLEPERPPGPHGRTFTDADVTAALEKMLVSPSFARSPRLQAFLRYIVEARLAGREDSPKEYELGTRIFDRGVHFVPQTDPIVRVQARQLRFKLREYYESDGAADPIRIDLPKGTYLPTFSDQEVAAVGVPLSAASAQALANAGPKRWWRARWMVWLLIAGALPLLLLALRKQIEPPPVVPYRPAANAHALYLAGRYYWNQRRPASLKKAVEDFTQATIEDPNYAQAYAGLADTYNLLPEYSAMPASDAYPRATKAAQRAIELDDASAEGHSALAFALFWGAWDAAGSEREFRRAIALDPNYTRAHHWFATSLEAEGRLKEALVEIDRARELDPTSPSVLADHALVLFDMDRRSEAMSELRELEINDPKSLSPHRYLASMYECTGDDSNFLQELQQQATLLEDATTATIAQAARRGFASGGEKGMLEALLQAQTHAYAEGHEPAYELAQTAALLGQPEQALRYLQTAYARHESVMMALPTECSFNRLQGNSTFQQLVARMNKATNGSNPTPFHPVSVSAR